MSKLSKILGPPICPTKDRKALCELAEPPKDSLKVQIEETCKRLQEAMSGNDVSANLLQARYTIQVYFLFMDTIKQYAQFISIGCDCHILSQT